MRNRKRMPAVLLLSVPLLMAAAGNGDLMSRFESDLKSKSAEIETIRCRFRHVRTMSILSSDVVLEGDFVYARPENILLSYDNGDFIKMTPTQFRMKNSGGETSAKMNSNPMLKELKRILSACMTGDVLSVMHGFELDLAEDAGTYRAELKPLNKKALKQLSSINLIFDKKDMSLCLLQMEERSGDLTSYRFTDKVFNREIDERIFR